MIVEDAVKTAELELLGWTSEEADQAWGQACLSFDHGGHDMQPRSSDRHLIYLAAWLESIDDDEDATSACDNPLLHIERIPRKSVLEHPYLAPRLDEIYEKARLQIQRCRARLKRLSTALLMGSGAQLFLSTVVSNGRRLCLTDCITRELKLGNAPLGNETQIGSKRWRANGYSLSHLGGRIFSDHAGKLRCGCDMDRRSTQPSGRT